MWKLRQQSRRAAFRTMSAANGTPFYRLNFSLCQPYGRNLCHFPEWDIWLANSQIARNSRGICLPKVAADDSKGTDDLVIYVKVGCPIVERRLISLSNSVSRKNLLRLAFPIIPARSCRTALVARRMSAILDTCSLQTCIHFACPITLDVAQVRWTGEMFK